MHWLDILIITVILFFCLIGISRGLISQIFSFAAIIGGFIAGVILYDLAGNLLIQYNLIESKSTSLLVGFMLVVIAVFVIIQILGWFTARVIGKLKLGWLNRLAGGVVGILIGIIITFFLLSWLNLYVIKDASAKKDSVMAPIVEEGYGIIITYIPGDLGKGYEATKKKIREEGEKALSSMNENEKSQSETVK
ncbi:MAG: CvpA family protein [Thermodesulfobacteriota bacterium]